MVRTRKKIEKPILPILSCKKEAKKNIGMNYKQAVKCGECEAAMFESHPRLSHCQDGPSANILDPLRRWKIVSILRVEGCSVGFAVAGNYKIWWAHVLAARTWPLPSTHREGNVWCKTRHRTRENLDLGCPECRFFVASVVFQSSSSLWES